MARRQPTFNPPTGLKVAGRTQANRHMTAEDKPQEAADASLTPQQKAARTRARNQAREAAETHEEPSSEKPTDSGERDTDQTETGAETSDEE